MNGPATVNYLDFGDFNFGDVLLWPRNYQNRGMTVYLSTVIQQI